MNKGLLICFIGMDGTGKTTLASETIKYLKATNIDCRYLWFNYGRLLWLLGEEQTYRNALLILLLYMVSIFEYAIFYAFEIFPALFNDETVVCDRYLYDVLVNLKYLGIYRERLANSIASIGRRPDFVFLLDVPTEIAYKRRKEGQIDQYNEKRRLYESMSRLHNCIVIDAKKSIKENQEQILSILSARLAYT